jgi:hypothetical protein
METKNAVLDFANSKSRSFPGIRLRPAPAGCYVCTCWIPGNFLVEGSLVADVAITTFVPFEAHFS